jgi:hypothetical protein
MRFKAGWHLWEMHSGRGMTAMVGEFAVIAVIGAVILLSGWMSARPPSAATRR